MAASMDHEQSDSSHIVISETRVYWCWVSLNIEIPLQKEGLYLNSIKSFHDAEASFPFTLHIHLNRSALFCWWVNPIQWHLNALVLREYSNPIETSSVMRQTPSASRKCSATVSPLRPTRERGPGGSFLWAYTSSFARSLLIFYLVLLYFMVCLIRSAWFIRGPNCNFLNSFYLDLKNK